MVSAIGSDYQAAYTYAVRALTRREHSEFELRRKLKSRRADDETIDQVVEALQSTNYQSDRRFSEEYIRTRTERGNGPRKIWSELLNRGVAESLVNELLVDDSSYWEKHALRADLKRFPPDVSCDASKEHDLKYWKRRVAFLEQRGYSTEVIFNVVGEYRS